MQIGLVGLQSSGKTTVFQTLTQIHLDSSTMLKRESNQAIVKVPDGRLDKLTNIFNPKKKVNATIEIVDFVGLQKGDHVNSKVITQFISKAKTNDALIHVVRGFEDENTVQEVKELLDKYNKKSIDARKKINLIIYLFPYSDKSVLSMEVP